MNKLTNILDVSQWCLIGASITDLNNILNTILLIISIALGIFSLVLKIVKASKDGKITDEELKEIQNDLEDLNSKINKEK